MTQIFFFSKIFINYNEKVNTKAQLFLLLYGNFRANPFAFHSFKDFFLTKRTLLRNTIKPLTCLPLLFLTQIL